MGVEFTPEALDLPTLFGREAPVVLEIGFGMGASLVAMAQQHRSVISWGLKCTRRASAPASSAHEAGVNNLRVMCHDAVEVLERMIPDASLDMVQLFFPDPGIRRVTISVVLYSRRLPGGSAVS